MNDVAAQAVIDQENSSFWDELCVTQLATSLGITDAGPASLQKFDDYFFAFYPYVFRHIPIAGLRDKDVLDRPRLRIAVSASGRGRLPLSRP